MYEGEKIGDYHLKKWYNEKIEKDSNNISLLSVITILFSAKSFLKVFKKTMIKMTIRMMIEKLINFIHPIIFKLKNHELKT